MKFCTRVPYIIPQTLFFCFIFGATQEHLCSAHLEEDQDQDQDQEDETKRTGVVDSSSDRSRATE